MLWAVELDAKYSPAAVNEAKWRGGLRPAGSLLCCAAARARGAGSRDDELAGAGRLAVAGESTVSGLLKMPELHG